MGDLWWPGDDRAGGLMGQAAFLEAMVSVEQAWLDTVSEVLADGQPGDAGAPRVDARVDLAGLVSEADLPDLARAADDVGNPAQPLVTLLRERSGCAWVHLGLTSQDVVDTALVLCLRDVVDRVATELAAQTEALVGLIESHRGSLMAARTLTQHAVPTTFARRAATWLDGVLDAREGLTGVTRRGWRVQVGGAAGTRAAVVELAGTPEAAATLVGALARRLGLEPGPPWHTNRSRLTAVADALVTCTDAWGHVATDVATSSRPEIGELAEAAPGGSSTMPHKRNPVLSVLVRRAALTATPLAGTLHLAAAVAHEERPDGAWHAEWDALRLLGRRTVVAASHTTELLAGLQVGVERMAATARSVWPDLVAERDAVAAAVGRAARPGDYLGDVDDAVEAVLARAERFAGEVR